MSSLIENEDTLPDPPRVQQLRVVEAVPASASASSRGHVRDRNEDRLGSLGTTFVVADGMGGRPGGEIAAIVAINFFLTAAAGVEPGAPLSVWRTVADQTSEAVRQSVHERGFDRAGTTLTAIAVETNRVVLVHVGDSRLYTIYEDQLHLSSHDHNVASELSMLRESANIAAYDGLAPQALTSFIGMPADTLDVFVRELPRHAGRRLLLCTDGVYRQVPEAKILALTNRLTLQDAATELIEQSNVAGGRDNATALLVEL